MHTIYVHKPTHPLPTPTSIPVPPTYLLEDFFFLSIPFPSHINHNTTHPSTASTASPHQTPPTKFSLNPSPNPHPPRNGPNVLAADEILCDTPLIVPNTFASDTLLFTRITAAGSANVLDTTCSAITTVNAGQTMYAALGRSKRKGIRAYANEEKGKKVRKDRNVPRYPCTQG